RTRGCVAGILLICVALAMPLSDFGHARMTTPAQCRGASCVYRRLARPQHTAFGRRPTRSNACRVARSVRSVVALENRRGRLLASPTQQGRDRMYKRLIPAAAALMLAGCGLADVGAAGA